MRPFTRRQFLSIVEVASIAALFDGCDWGRRITATPGRPEESPTSVSTAVAKDFISTIPECQRVMDRVMLSLPYMGSEGPGYILPAPIAYLALYDSLRSLPAYSRLFVGYTDSETRDFFIGMSDQLRQVGWFSISQQNMNFFERSGMSQNPYDFHIYARDAGLVIGKDDKNRTVILSAEQNVSPGLYNDYLAVAQNFPDEYVVRTVAGLPADYAGGNLLFAPTSDGNGQILFIGRDLQRSMGGVYENFRVYVKNMGVETVILAESQGSEPQATGHIDFAASFSLAADGLPVAFVQSLTGDGYKGLKDEYEATARHLQELGYRVERLEYPATYFTNPKGELTAYGQYLRDNLKLGFVIPHDSNFSTSPVNALPFVDRTTGKPSIIAPIYPSYLTNGEIQSDFELTNLKAAWATRVQQGTSLDDVLNDFASRVDYVRTEGLKKGVFPRHVEVYQKYGISPLPATNWDMLSVLQRNGPHCNQLSESGLSVGI